MEQTQKRKKEDITIPTLVQKYTPYPTIVVPLGNNGSISHAITVVDDLVFDSTQKYALTLSHKYFHWICGGLGTSDQVWGTIRFNRPIEKGHQAYNRTIQKNQSVC